MNLTFDEAKSLPIGTLLVFACQYKIKEENRVYCIVTETGINYFQYSWYKKKFASDPTSYGIGIPVKIYGTPEFYKINIPPLNLEKKELNNA